MNFETLSTVKFGDVDSLGEFLFENGTQHKLFQETFMDLGISVPVYPITDASVDNLDDWLLAHQVENATVGSGYNAMSAGNVTVANGVVVTVSAGSRWVII